MQNETNFTVGTEYPDKKVRYSKPGTFEKAVIIKRLMKGWKPNQKSEIYRIK